MKYTRAMEREDYDRDGGFEDSEPQDPDLLSLAETPDALREGEDDDESI